MYKQNKNTHVHIYIVVGSYVNAFGDFNKKLQLVFETSPNVKEIILYDQNYCPKFSDCCVKDGKPSVITSMKKKDGYHHYFRDVLETIYTLPHLSNLFIVDDYRSCTYTLSF